MTFSSGTELLNVQTGQTCKLAALPVDAIVGPTGSNFQGSPIVCGGHVTIGGWVDISDICYRFNQGSWLQVRYSAKFVNLLIV